MAPNGLGTALRRAAGMLLVAGAATATVARVTAPPTPTTAATVTTAGAGLAGVGTADTVGPPDLRTVRYSALAPTVPAEAPAEAGPDPAATLTQQISVTVVRADGPAAPPTTSP
ncbi:MAG TPA: hypothetical protein VFH58_13440 [Acidimicrobiales bacterium]|nr:hypothetical protein [Acidimicrobiales bacterium]